MRFYETLQKASVLRKSITVSGECATASGQARANRASSLVNKVTEELTDLSSDREGFPVALRLTE